MSSRGHAATNHDKSRIPAPGSGTESHSPIAYSAGHVIAPEDSAVEKGFALRAGLVFLGMAVVLAVGFSLFSKTNDDGVSGWRSLFGGRAESYANRPLNIGAVSLDLKPESLNVLPTRPHFTRTGDGRVTAEFTMDGGAYTIWFAHDREGRQAQRIRFTKTVDGVSAEDTLKKHVSSFGPPAETECSRLLAHTGRTHCRYSWNRSDGSTATLNLRALAPTADQPRTEVTLFLNAPGKAAPR